jgi:class 3 adenylate cyclase
MADERIQRRLAAILAADVVGYSRLIERDEAGTLALRKSRRAEILQPAVSKHRGRVVKLMGDGMLVEFGSAVNAVELQASMDIANPGVSAICLVKSERPASFPTRHDQTNRCERPGETVRSASVRWRRGRPAGPFPLGSPHPARHAGQEPGP